MAICFERLNNKVRKVSLTLYPRTKKKRPAASEFFLGKGTGES